MNNKNKILVADDDPVSLIALKTVIEKLGYQVITATNGKDAYRILQQDNPPQLMFLDWEMPYISGIELCQKLSKIGNVNRFFYKIILTGKNDREAITKAFDHGADDYISKPFSVMELTARLKAGFRIINMYKEKHNQIKQLAQADRMISLGIMAAGVAHEINNPATFISGNIQLIEEVWDSIKNQLELVPKDKQDRKVKIIVNEMPEILVDINNGINRITEIVRGLKSFTRTDHNQRKLTSITSRIEEALKICRSKINDNIIIQEKFQKDLPLVIINSVEIEQVFVNLIINAIDAIKQGIIIIETSIDENNIVVNIIDNGPGIPKDVINQLFTPFFTTKAVGKGTGLGLSISQNIIQDHGGSIKATNNKDQGATFTISLPIAEQSS